MNKSNIIETQTKTVREWFNELPEPYRSQAIANTLEAVLDCLAANLAEALIISFFWSATPQGHEYWDKIYEELLKTY